MTIIPEYGIQEKSGLAIWIEDMGKIDAQVYKFEHFNTANYPSMSNYRDMRRFVDLPIVPGVKVKGHEHEWRICKVMYHRDAECTQVFLVGLAQKSPRSGRTDGRLRLLCLAKKDGSSTWFVNGTMLVYSDPTFKEEVFRFPSPMHMEEVYAKINEMYPVS